MASKSPTPTSVNMAALKGQRPGAHNLMFVGSGTPWEDRGERGLFLSFFSTCFAGMGKPGQLFHSIRRPETKSDPRSFVIACGIYGGIAFVVSQITWLILNRAPEKSIGDLFDTMFLVGCAVKIALSPLILWFVVKTASTIYFKMVGAELGGSLNPALIFNVLAYSLSPGLVAIIPLFGPPLALLWILVVLIFAGRRRLGLKIASAIIGAVIPLVAMTAMCVGAYYLLIFLSGLVLKLYS